MIESALALVGIRRSEIVRKRVRGSYAIGRNAFDGPGINFVCSLPQNTANNAELIAAI